MSGTIDTRIPQYSLTVGGHQRTVFSGTVELGTDIYVSSADLRLDPAEGRPTPGGAVEVRAGYLGDYPLPLLFVGTVDDDALALWPWDQSIKCSGALNRTTLPIGTPRLPTDPGPGGLPISYDPATNPDVVVYYDSSGPQGRTWTDGQIVTDILSRYGIVNVNIADSGLVMATLLPILVLRDQVGAQLLQEIDELLGYRTYDGPDGVVRRVPISLNPSGGYARSYREGVDLYRATHTRTRRQVRNRVVLQGLPNLRGSTGTPYQPMGIAQGMSPYVPTPPGYQAYTWSSALAETAAVCNAYATRKLGELNRLAETVSYDLMQGDSRLAPNMTALITAPHLGQANGNRSRILHVRHTLGAAFNTTIQVVTVTAAEGVNPDLPPIAVIDAIAEQETLADGTTLMIVALNGTNSYDPDGQVASAPDRGIASYLWTASQGTVTATSGGRLATLLVTGPLAPSASVTLSVTDTDTGQSGTASRLIGASGMPVQVRDIWAALTTDLQFSGDGQKTWSGFGIAAVGICEVAAPTYNLAWDAGGTLYRCLATLTSSAVTGGPTNVTAASISLDTQGLPTHIAWAGASDGRVWRSTDDGQTWPAATGVPSGTVTAIAESPYSPGDVTAVAGNVTWHSYDAGFSWQPQDSYPDARYAAQRFAAGIAADGKARGFTAYTGPAPASGAATGVVRERAGIVTTSFAATAAPLTITGLTLSLDGTSLVATDIPSAPPARTWQIDATVGGPWTQRAYNSVFGNPRHIIRDGRIPGLIYGAADNALFKTPDEFLTTLTMRSLSGSLAGRMIGYGDLHAIVPLVIKGDMLWVAGTIDGNGRYSGAVINALTASGLSRRASHAAFPLPDGATMIPLRQVAPGILIAFGVFKNNGYPPAPQGAANCLRSTDGGATWLAISVPYVSWVATDGNGGCYALAWGSDGTQAGPNGGLYRSTDSGATWTFCVRFDGTNNTGPRAQHVIASPTNPMHVMVRQTYGRAQDTAYHLSTDGGATFNPTIGVYEYAFSYGGITGSYSPDGAYVLTRDETPLDSPLVRSPEAGPAGGTVLNATDARGIIGFATTSATRVAYGSTGAFRSLDGGVTWPAILANPGVTLQFNGFVPGDAATSWYALNAAGIQQQPATDTPTPGGWTAIPSAQLAAAFPDGIVACAPQGALRLNATGGGIG